MQRHRLSGIFAVILILCACAASSSAYAFKLKANWNEYKSEHFIIYSDPGVPNKYISEFTRKCESYYHLITDRLGFNRFDFWLWENRARIFIYKTREDYLKDTDQPEWSEAAVHVRKKFISTFYFEKDFFDTILPHELAHITLREFIGAKSRVPLWFEEGIACSNEKDSVTKYLLLAKGFAGRGVNLAVAQMEKIDQSQLSLPAMFYSTAASVVIFLLEEYQKENFVQLCRELRDGNSFYGAMDKVYQIKDAEDLNNKYLTFLNNKSYEELLNSEGVSINW